MSGLIGAAHPLAHVNAALNATATLLLLVGYCHIRRGREAAHRRAMLAAFLTSVLFLACYLFYHYRVGHVSFSGTGTVRRVYLAILASHIVLACLVPPLAMATIVLGQRATGRWLPAAVGRLAEPERDEYDRRVRRRHRLIARWTFPIWLYVSVTGVVVYGFLYHLYP